MKRFLVIPLMMLYLLAASGMRIHLHFCGSAVASWEIFADAEGCLCEKSTRKKEVKDKCCREEMVLAKMEQDHQQVPGLHFKLTPSEDAWLPPTVFGMVRSAPIIAPQQTAAAHRPNAPPGLWQCIPLYKLHGRFTYYG